MRAFLLIAVAALAACEAQKPVEEMGYAERQQLAAQIVERCKALGIAPGSAHMNACTEAEASKEVYTRRANTAKRQAALQSMGQSMQQTSQSYYNAAAMNQSRNVNCTTQNMGGGMVTTRCY